MLSNPSAYSPQGLGPQFSGFQGAGFPGTFGLDPAHAGAQQQPAYGTQGNWLPQGPFAPNPYAPNLFGSIPGNPYLQHLQNTQLGAIGHNSYTQQVIPILGQIAQQIAAQSAMTQQLGVALHQLVQHLAAQGQYGGQGQQGFNLAGVQQLGGFNPQAQAWGINRPPTVQ